ncbi:MAG TPA: hypothetical protein VN366_11815 [Feifaniaceae bacterium]|nr:hypothetical protein [Feifaniaceae bacterium]
MRKGKNDREPDIDLLLRDAAAKENDALPLEDWKRQLYKKIESDDQPRRDEPPEELPIADELAARRRKNMRRFTVGFSTVAAALLIVLGTRQYWQQNLSAKSAPEEIRMAAEAAPYDAAAPAAPAPSESALPEALYAAPEAPALEAPAATEAPAADTKDKAAPAPSASADSAAGSGKADMGIMSGPVELTPEQRQAVDAVNAALPEERGRVDDAAALVTLLEDATFTVRPLSGAEAVEITRARIYWVEADPSAENAPAYAVDADTYEVLGEIVRG